MFGNILMLVNADAGQQSSVNSLLGTKGILFEQLGNLFFLETATKKQTNELASAISNLHVNFVFFHNSISDGSFIKSQGLSDATLTKLNQIMFV